MYTKHTNRRPGKFEGNDSQHVARVLYECCGYGPDEQVGSVDEIGWYGLVEGKRFTFIVDEDSSGFFGYAVFSDPEEAEEQWDRILAQYARYYDQESPLVPHIERTRRRSG